MVVVELRTPDATARRDRRHDGAAPGSASARPIVLVPGLQPRESSEWLRAWRERHPEWIEVVPDDPATPRLDRWAASIARALDVTRGLAIVVAHGFGSLAAIRATHLLERRIAAALFVAPGDPDRFDVASRLPSQRLPYPSVLVATRHDPALKLTKAGALATRWGSRFVAADATAFEDANGRWPGGLAIVAAMQRALRHAAVPLRPGAAE